MNKRLSYMVWQNMSDEEQQHYNALYDKFQGIQMVENLKNGMTVYFYHDLDTYVIKGTVKDSTLRDMVPYNIKYIKAVHWEMNVDDEGKEVEPIVGTSGVYLDKVFLTAKEAYDAQEAEIEKHKREYRAEITDVESLLKFPLKHCLSGGNPDWWARAVYEECIEKYKNELKGYINF